MKIFIVMDPLEKLYLQYDSTLYLIKECYRRGHAVWVCDSPAVFADERSVYARASRIQPKRFKDSWPLTRPCHGYDLSPAEVRRLQDFDLILLRKEPPVDMNYIYLTQLLDRVADEVPVSNHPAGVRNNNEKLSCFRFPEWSPRSFVSSRTDAMFDFQSALQRDLVVKPLDERAGNGIFKIRWKDPAAKKQLDKASGHGRKMLLAQEFIPTGKKARDKRVTLLNGRPLFVYEKRAKGKDFRTNLSLGGTAHPALLSNSDRKLIKTLTPYLKSQGLHLVGLDILEGRLIDFNVTCPGGFADAMYALPGKKLVEPWVDFLEDFVSAFQPHRGYAPSQGYSPNKAKRAPSPL